MKRHQAIRPIKIMPSRSLAWAARLTLRHCRLTDFSRLSMLLYVPALARTLVLLQQRWLTSSLNLQPQVNLSLNQRSVFNTWANTVNAVLQAQTTSSPTQLDNRSKPVLRDVHKTRYVRESENRQRLALTLAINRTSNDLTTALSQKFSVQREAQIREVSTLLTQRVRRTSESAAVQTPMAFRAPVSNRVTPAAVASEVFKQRDVFEKRRGPSSVPPIAQPVLNVELLADQVMKQIDRRVIARRERMGQI